MKTWIAVRILIVVALVLMATWFGIMSARAFD